MDYFQSASLLIIFDRVTELFILIFSPDLKFGRSVLTGTILVVEVSNAYVDYIIMVCAKHCCNVIASITLCNQFRLHLLSWNKNNDIINFSFNNALYVRD